MGIVDDIKRRAAEGDVICQEWLEHQEAKSELRGLARMIREGKLKEYGEGKQEEGPGQ